MRNVKPQPKKFKAPTAGVPNYTSKSMPGKNAIQQNLEKGLNVSTSKLVKPTSNFVKPTSNVVKPASNVVKPTSKKEQRKADNQQFKKEKQAINREISLAKLSAKKEAITKGTRKSASEKANAAAASGAALLSTATAGLEFYRRLKNKND